jgi:hypothetical protein
MTVNVTNTVGANNTIVLDSNSKIPAIDGSQVTALNASAFSTGTLAIARIDAGTSGANKILQLDGNAKIPAISGANLTNAPGPTVSTSDPAIDTNSTLGAKWVNKTSGEVYICTDATAGANVWTNVGAGSGDVQPWTYGGTIAGWTMGGYRGSYVNTIDKVSYTSDGNATDAGNLRYGMQGAGSCADSTHGYVCGGSTPPGAPYYNEITKFQFSTDGDCVDLADLINYPESTTGVNGSTHGYICGGAAPSSPVDVIQKFAFVSTANATDVGNLLAVGKMRDSGTQNESYGFICGNEPKSNVIQKISFSSDGNSTDHGDLKETKNGHAGHSSPDYGFVSGCEAPSSYQIERFSFASNVTATDWADMTSLRRHGCGSSSSTHGYYSGGVTSLNTIDKFPYASQTNSTDVGDMIGGGYALCGTQY